MGSGILMVLLSRLLLALSNCFVGLFFRDCYCNLISVMVEFNSSFRQAWKSEHNTWTAVTLWDLAETRMIWYVSFENIDPWVCVWSDCIEWISTKTDIRCPMLIKTEILPPISLSTVDKTNKTTKMSANPSELMVHIRNLFIHTKTQCLPWFCLKYWVSLHRKNFHYYQPPTSPELDAMYRIYSSHAYAPQSFLFLSVTF